MAGFGRPLRVAVLFLAPLVLLTSCSGGGRTANSGSASAAGKADTPRIKIAMVTHSGPGDTFWDIVRKGGTAAAAKDNAQLLYAADPDGSKQAQLVDQYVEQKVAGIVVSNAKPEALLPSLKKAEAAGIPVVTINSGADRFEESGAIAHFGQNEEVAGEAAGKELKKLGVKKNICVIHEQGNVGLESRCAGVKKTYPSSQILYVQGTDMTQVNSTITAKLQADKSIDSVLTLGAPFALTAIGSAKDAGSSAKISTFDMNAEAAKALSENKLQFIVDQQPYLQGYEGVDAIWLKLNGGFALGGGKPVLTGPAIVTPKEAKSVLKFAEEGLR